MAKFDTDSFGFENHEIISVLRQSLPDNSSETINILECKDDIIFAWNSKECAILTLNWRAAKAKNDGSIKYQTLVPSRMQNFSVDKITVSNEGSFVALSGPRGVSILELPRRWGPNGQYSEGKGSIICSAHNLDERFFVNLEILQVRWHPASPKDSHLLVLVSNNTIRVYDESNLRHVWRVGPIPCALPPTGTQFPYLNSLGDTAVDFDIAPPRVVTFNDNGKDVNSLINDSYTSLKSEIGDGGVSGGEKVEWPLIVLRGNGSIYIVLIGIDTEKPRIQGPISMYPQTRDNYGHDSCAIAVIPSLPPTIVIAESTGRLHHAIFVEAEIAEESLHEIDSSLVIYPSEWEIHVLETVELELGLSEKDEANSTVSLIHLKRDLLNESRYFAYHNTGLHAMTLYFVRQLQMFVESKDPEAENINLLNNPSHVEYLVCTKALDSSKINPVLGFALLQSPSGLVLLLGSGQIVSLNMVADATLIHGYGSSSSKTIIPKIGNSGNTKTIFDDSFETHIRNILTTEVSHPLLKLDKSSEPSPKECLELLTHSIQILRDQYFIRLDKAREEILKRLKLQQMLKQHQLHEVAQLQKEKEQIREKAERLAEIYEDSYERQQILLKRSQEIIRLASSAMPHLSIGEKEFRLQIEKISNLTKSLTNKFGIIKKKIDCQEAQINQYQIQKQIKRINLQPKTETTIKDAISEFTNEIDDNIKDLKRIKTALNLS